MAPEPRRGLLIDWGGVLTTSPYDSFAAFALAEGLDENAPREAFGRGGHLHELIVGLESGLVTDPEFEQGLTAGLGLDPSRQEGIRARLFAGMRRDHVVRRAVWGLRAQGIRTGLLSNSIGTGGYEQKVLDELFDIAVISGEVGVRKPDPAIYALAVERMEMNPQELVYVDDLRANLAPAEAIGMETILHRRSADTVAELSRLLGVELPAA